MPPASAFEPLDDYERELMQAEEKGQFQFLSPKETEKMGKMLQEAAQNTVKKIPVQIRLAQYDVDKIKFIAEQEGIPYQTYIRSIVRKYLSKHSPFPTEA